MKKQIIYGFAITVLILGGLLIAAEKATLKVDGSTTVGPIGDAFAEYFKKSYPNVEISVSKTGSGNGAAALIDGRCDIAMMSRFMKDTEFKAAVEKGVYPVVHTIAMDGVCVIVHPSNPVSQLQTCAGSRYLQWQNYQLEAIRRAGFGNCPYQPGHVIRNV